MKRLVFGILIVSVIALFILWHILALTFVIIRMLFGVLAFFFCAYVLYVFWGALMRMMRNRN